MISLSSCSAEELTEKQDGNLEHLREYLVSEAVPSAEELYRCNPEVKCYHLERDFFRLDDLGVIWRQTGDPGDSEPVLVPRTLRDEVMRLCHDVSSTGHQGATGSKERLRQNFNWWHLSSDIKDYVRTCDACNRNKKSSLPHQAPYKVYQAGSPMKFLPFRGEISKANCFVKFANCWGSIKTVQLHTDRQVTGKWSGAMLMINLVPGTNI